MNKDHKEFEDESLNKVTGKINFKEKKNKQFFKVFLKGVAFFTIAAISGGVSGAFISGRQIPTYIYPSNITLLDPGNINATEYGISSKNDVNKVAEKVSPAIVGVQTEGDMNKVGNGIIFKPDGYIVTSYKLIKGNGRISVLLQNNDNKYPAKLVGFDEPSDIAVVKIGAMNLPIAKFADAAKLNVGDFVIAIGNPNAKQQISGMLTTGVLSTTNKSVESEKSTEKNRISFNILLTDAIINEENVNGPLCNLSGEVIGINKLGIGKFINNINGLGFALSINNANKIIDTILNVNSISKAQIGVTATTAVLQDSSIKGAYIQEVILGTGADAAGLKPTDIVTEIDGIKINKLEEFKLLISKHKVGDTVHLNIWRNAKIIGLDVLLTEQRDNNV